MEAIQLQRWWLAASVVATLLANWAGGFSLAVTAVFALIYLTGVVLIGRDEYAQDTQDTKDTQDTQSRRSSGPCDAVDSAQSGDD